MGQNKKPGTKGYWIGTTLAVLGAVICMSLAFAGAIESVDKIVDATTLTATENSPQTVDLKKGKYLIASEYNKEIQGQRYSGDKVPKYFQTSPLAGQPVPTTNMYNGVFNEPFDAGDVEYVVLYEIEVKEDGPYSINTAESVKLEGIAGQNDPYKYYLLQSPLDDIANKLALAGVTFLLLFTSGIALIIITLVRRRKYNETHNDPGSGPHNGQKRTVVLPVRH